MEHQLPFFQMLSLSFKFSQQFIPYRLNSIETWSQGCAHAHIHFPFRLNSLI